MASSILRYFKVREDQHHPLLPIAMTNGKKLANIAVQKELMENRKRRGEYHVYDDEVRAKVGRYAIENGNKAAVTKYSAMLGHPISESTVRGLKKRYLAELERVKDPAMVKKLPRCKAGRPLKLGKYDDDVKKYVTSLRLAGGIVNRSIVIAAAKGIVEGSDPSRLTEHGGDISLDVSWAQSFLQRLGYVRRKGTKAARKVPSDFEAIKAAYYLDRIRVAATIDDQFVPPQLIINLDQTNAKFIPVSEWILDKEGSKQVSIIGKEDKREMTVLLSCTLGGKLLPPQLIYAGCTNRCHPNFTFPNSWNVTHSTNHWSTEDTMLEFLDKIIIPYVDNTRQCLELSDDFRAVAIFDVFAAHRCQSVLDRLESSNIKPVFVPAGCTGELQPLDITVNDAFKRELKSCFTTWYAKEVSKALKNGEDVEKIKVNLAISVIKPLHSNWLLYAMNKICEKERLIQTSFEKAGITSCFN